MAINLSERLRVDAGYAARRTTGPMRAIAQDCTEAADEIERLREELHEARMQALASDGQAHEALGQSERLTRELSSCGRSLADEVEVRLAAEDRSLAAEQRIQVLEGALKPFADYADAVAYRRDDQLEVGWMGRSSRTGEYVEVNLTASHFRSALTALKGDSNGQ